MDLELSGVLPRPFGLESACVTAVCMWAASSVGSGGFVSLLALGDPQVHGVSCSVSMCWFVRCVLGLLAMGLLGSCRCSAFPLMAEQQVSTWGLPTTQDRQF